MESKKRKAMDSTDGRGDIELMENILKQASPEDRKKLYIKMSEMYSEENPEEFEAIRK